LGDARAQGEVALREANLARITGRYSHAAARSQEVIAHAEKAGARLLEAQGYAMLGLVMRHQGNFPEAGEWLALAQEQVRSLGEEELAAQIAYWIGLNHYSADRFEEARRNVLAARESFEQMGNRMGQANCLLLLGTIANRIGDIGGSLEQLGKALEACRAVGWRAREPVVMLDLSAVWLEIGEYETAQRLLEGSLAISRETGYREAEAVGLDTLGLTEQMRGQHEKAVELCLEALVVIRELGDRRSEGYALTHLGYSRLELGRLTEAREDLTRAMALRLELDDKTPTVVDNLAALARVAVGENQPSEAVSLAVRTLDQMRDHGAGGVEYPIRAYLDCYRVLCAHGGADEMALAKQALAEARALLDQRAANISDADLRNSFLFKVPFNRDLLQLTASGATA
jgi:tetratricopeptide (TPR) repeat protein